MRSLVESQQSKESRNSLFCLVALAVFPLVLSVSFSFVGAFRIVRSSLQRNF